MKTIICNVPFAEKKEVRPIDKDIKEIMSLSKNDLLAFTIAYADYIGISKSIYQFTESGTITFVKNKNNRLTSIQHNTKRYIQYFKLN